MTDDETRTDGPGEHARRTDEERTNERRADSETDRPGTMADVDHEHPYEGWQRNWRLFGRGSTVAADGGRRADAPRRGTLGDVDHTPPSPDDEGATRVWLRGLKRRLDRGV